jgi:hypothetical protein
MMRGSVDSRSWGRVVGAVVVVVWLPLGQLCPLAGTTVGAAVAAVVVAAAKVQGVQGV